MDVLVGGPTRATGGRRPGSRRTLSVVATAVGVLVALGWAGDTGASAGVVPAAALGGARMTCGGLVVTALPGRRVGAAEQSGPAEGIAQLLRLSEWSRRSPYDGARWWVLPAGDGAALLVATQPGRAAYIPVRRRPDGHWQIDAPCRPQFSR
jgi:hypothetical protein